MQRQRGELVPIGEVIADLPGPVQALIPSRSTQHHFTLADQVHQLVTASETTPDLGFMAPVTGAVLPAAKQPRQPAPIQARQRAIHALHDGDGWQQTPLRQPATFDPRLDLHRSGTDPKPRARPGALALGLHAVLGVYSTSGGKYTRLRNQMKRLFGCSVSMTYEDKHGEQFVSSLIAERGEFWWNERKPDEPSLWNSKIELGEKFFNEIINHPVPLNMNTLMALKRSTLGLDLYLWLVYRTFPLRAPLRLTWRLLYSQFGAHPANASDRVTVRNFQRKVLRELKKIKLAWPELNYTTAPGVLILLPSTPAIAPLNQGQLTS